MTRPKPPHAKLGSLPRMPELTKNILILAGPNGAGKTTFAEEFLVPDANCPTFVNADLIALELSPADPLRAAMPAGRIMLSRILACVERGESFAFETTLADRGYARRIPQWRSVGYHVSLWFLALPSPDVAVSRVEQRVRQGGHSVPEAVIRRRFTAGRANFDQLKSVVDAWTLYDSSGNAPQLLDWGEPR